MAQGQSDLPNDSATAEDPHAAREAERYDNPIPSREYLLELLQQDGEPMTAEAVFEVLGLEGEQQLEAVSRRLGAMRRDGQLLRLKGQRYVIRHPSDTKAGIVQGHRDGFGFLITEEGEDDVFLSLGQMRGVFHGDEVKAEVTGFDRKGRPEGRIIEVVSSNTDKLAGRLHSSKGKLWLEPDNVRIRQRIQISPEDAGNAEDGDIVSVEITQQPHWRDDPRGKVIESLGAEDTPGIATELALRSHDIPHEWPDEVVAEAASIGGEPTEADKKGRVDIRQLPLVTIDGEDARDFDDAVFCQKKKSGGWRLWVAIADVSHYVQVGSALDKEGYLRGTSVYFPDRVVPMLPEALSNGLCSLKPEVDRLCMVCEMTISATGKISGYRFYEAVMHSHARLTYNKVAAMLGLPDVDPAANDGAHDHLMPHINELYALYGALRGARDTRGAIDFETVETRVVFDAERRIDEIVPVHRNAAHKIIEECMLAANVATAQLLDKCGLDALFRVHEGPNEQKLKNLRDYLGEQGLSLAGGSKPTPKEYQALLDVARTRPDATVIQTMMLRSLSQAVYQPENNGHFGLHYAAYAHFTSPIRRYPDLLVHRAIRCLIRTRPASKHFHREPDAKVLKLSQIYPYDTAAMAALGEHCSMTERRADDASRDVMAWLKCEFLEQHIGDVFEGTINAVTGFGMFVEMHPLYIEGLVHVTELGQDFYQFDQAKQRLIGERSGQVYRLGDSISVKVLRVNSDDRKIDLGLDPATMPNTPKAPKGAKKPRRGKGASAAKPEVLALGEQKQKKDKAAKGAMRSGKGRRKKR